MAKSRKVPGMFLQSNTENRCPPDHLFTETVPYQRHGSDPLTEISVTLVKWGSDFGCFVVAFVHNCAQPRVTCGVISGSDEKATKMIENHAKTMQNTTKTIGNRSGHVGGVLKWCLPTNSTIADRPHLVSCLKSFIGGRVVRIVPFLLRRAVLLVDLRVG